MDDIQWRMKRITWYCVSCSDLCDSYPLLVADFFLKTKCYLDRGCCARHTAYPPAHSDSWLHLHLSYPCIKLFFVHSMLSIKSLSCRQANSFCLLLQNKVHEFDIVRTVCHFAIHLIQKIHNT